MSDKNHDFTILNSGSKNPRVHILSNELRQVLFGLEIIGEQHTWDEDSQPSQAKQERIKRNAIFNVASIHKDLSAIEEDLITDDIKPFRDAIAAEHELLRNNARSMFENEKVSYQMILVALKVGDEIIVRTDDTEHGAIICNIAEEENFFGKYLSVSYMFVSHDGTKFTLSTRQRTINQFEGERDVRKFGISFMTDGKRKQFEELGRKFIDICSSAKHMSYTGPITRRSWAGSDRYRADGRVIVDIRSMKMMEPHYRDYYLDNSDDENDGVDLETHLHVMSPYVYGFSFLSKKWGEFLVSSLTEISYHVDAFDNLVLPKERKHVIESLVRRAVAGGKGDDLIDNKGGGVTFLLHGAPGVGKTLTAEAIAERLKRPLYMVGAGELGTDPGELEERLKNILDVTHSWKALLLIDECDIFLERREKNDIVRNAMVGIFLRLLEYHQGILFLTTNRVSDIDPAFLSRISIGLHYPELDIGSKQQVWTNLLTHAGVDAEGFDICRLAERDLNGRQIKNFIRLAKSISEERGDHLCQEDIENIIGMSDEFKKFFN